MRQLDVTRTLDDCSDLLLLLKMLCVGGGCFLQKGLNIDAEDEKI